MQTLKLSGKMVAIDISESKFILKLDNTLEGSVSAECSSLEECSEKLRYYIEEETMWELGASHCRKGFGEVRQNGLLVARIGYNGRIFTPEQWKAVCA